MKLLVHQNLEKTKGVSSTLSRTAYEWKFAITLSRRQQILRHVLHDLLTFDGKRLCRHPCKDLCAVSCKHCSRQTICCVGRESLEGMPACPTNLHKASVEGSGYPLKMHELERLMRLTSTPAHPLCTDRSRSSWAAAITILLQRLIDSLISLASRSRSKH